MVTTNWNTLDFSQSLSTIAELKVGDRVSIVMGNGNKQKRLKCYCKKEFSFFGLYIIG